MKNLFIALSVCFLLFSCNCNNCNKKTKKIETETKDGHNAKNSLDIFGTYVAAGDSTTIIIGNDNSFEFIKEGVSKSGKYVWDENGQLINIDNTTYFVGENTLTLFENGKKVEGNSLHKK